MQLYAGLEKYSCDMCGKLGEKPTHTVLHIASKTQADICKTCYHKCMKHQKFLDGIESKHIKLITR